MEKVSIVVITLNEAERIGRLLEDLSNQTHQGFEVILVDSQSEDDTCEIALGYQSQLPELTVHEMDARGVSLGRNTGAKLAKYERLLFLDADVRLSPDFLSRALHKLDHTKLEVAGVYMGANGLPLMHKLGYGLFNLGCLPHNMPSQPLLAPASFQPKPCTNASVASMKISPCVRIATTLTEHQKPGAIVCCLSLLSLILVA
ncbi:beta-1,3-glucosyltransferase [Vibrio ishigakensis]|uniref:Beta-1,3-glucosyltransferase n=1 Tax=Vibrio ishigakensis TaxID=1481914 RepID=A0A0B8PAV8_9VIBR|nr:beta-1,3-glucosyltransferase [Vibrio ishigakensis]